MTMASVLRETLHTLRAWPIFAFYILVTLAVAGFNGVMVLLMMLEGDLPGAFGQMTHGTTEIHRTHDLTFGFLFVPAVVGMLVQLWRPALHGRSFRARTRTRSSRRCRGRLKGEAA